MSGYVWKGKPAPKIRAKTNPGYTTIRCGTYSGYRNHYSNGEKPCEPCRQAGVEYKQEYRAREANRAPIHEGTLRLLIATAEAADWDRRKRNKSTASEVT